MSLFEPKMMKNQGLPSSSRVDEKGSVIVWILIMVTLFAALGYAVSQGSRGSTAQLSEQQAQLGATEILDYARQIKDTVRQLQINGCDETEIDHGNTIYKQENGTNNYAPGTNLNAPPDGSCGIFHTNGGSLRPRIFDNVEPTPSGATLASGHATLTDRDILGIGTDGELDTVFVISGINQQICVAINNSLGVENPNDFPPAEVDIDPIIGDEASDLVGQSTFCLYKDSATNKRHIFHQVLLAR